ncbi:mandelate racemase/muconate lactonizing enzyme family protein [Catalinimonas niigatensis]|uniref:mandelate racemase/muconate lactonizing enzyme family protein n=1 Tax=Catalinimonas niigatensis TaxID=1397264 RepID=UPI00266660BE|nr:mandelate racemase/muconate lactonizing enzyme family protein [Catalinimonas niigatensis]WPP51462.1 mandelate racemase/muconate lactonizing enzyme family protein [Catalinimonas niigatensis]
MLSRRHFVKIAGTIPFLPTPDSFAADPSFHAARPLIKKISIFNSSGSFYRFVGMNSYDTAPKGIKGSRKSVMIEFSDGTLGLGTVGYTNITESIISKIRQLIKQDPLSFYQWNGDQIAGVVPAMQPYFYNTDYAWVESAILDGIGKMKNLPVWKMLGESKREGIDPYDGTLYFEEIANNTDVSLIGEIGKRIKEDGYRAIKMKLGRPSKWLPGEAGVERDIEAFITLREAVGQNFNIMADANNGYKGQHDWAVKLMTACAPYHMYFMEELFPDNAQQYLRLREALLKENFFIPIAEGEDIREMDKFDQYCQEGLYNYIQPDMATCGTNNILQTARQAEKFPHVKLIPHVWQSQLGLIMSLHVSKVQHNIPYVEDSRYFEHAFIPSGYIFRNGQWFIPDKPGWGVELSPDFRQFIADDEIVIT